MAACKFRFALEVLEGSKTISYPAMTDPGSVALRFLIQLHKINIIILLADFFSRKLSYERLTCVSKRPPPIFRKTTLTPCLLEPGPHL